MEENKLNIDELKQVSGGKNVSGFKKAAIIKKTTEYFKDKNMKHYKGIFTVDDEVWVTSFEEGSNGKVYHVVARTGNKEGYVPNGTVMDDPDE